jgi:hypothetical protein
MDTGSLWTSPRYFALRIEPAENRVVFVPLAERLYRSLAFLDDRYVPTSESMEMPLDAMVAHVRAVPRSERRPVQCIFHVAFCGSTLVSRCLDRLRGAMVLKEPFPFHEVAWRKRHPPADAREAERQRSAFDVMMALLGRTFRPGQVAVVKPTDASTNLLPDVLAHAESSAALFLYVGLEPFLASMLTDELRRGFVRERVDDLLPTHADHPAFRGVEAGRLTDAERAACLWLLHLQLYGDAVREDPGARSRSLDFAAFLADPAGMLAGIARLFGIAASRREVDAAVAAETALHSKSRGTPFTAADRQRALASAAERYRDEIRQGLAWAERRCAEHAFPPAPPLPL